MFTWSNIMAFASNFVTSGWEFLQSNFSTSLVGSLTGAFGGAWAAQRIAEKVKFREELLKEIRTTNSAMTSLYVIANGYIALKKQHIKKLHRSFHEERNRFELFMAAKRAGTAPPQQQYEFRADMETLRPIYCPIDQVQSLLSNQTSLSHAIFLVLPILISCLQSLDEALNERNNLISEWKGRNAPLSSFEYFGIEHKNVTDYRYMSAIDAINTLTDDVIAYSILIGDALHKHATKQIELYRKNYREGTPALSKIIFSKNQEMIPNMENYNEIYEMLKIKD